ncbi:MAG: hypothetical protein JSU77_08340 [Fidelibacterota bacterium]|nr:MAG: hypothetical protein JSU77_08340 [Candidatus Neomarinimicrobiota bacterium]
MRYSSLIIVALLVSAGYLVAQSIGTDATDRIIFSHLAHVDDMGLECNECHEGLETSTQVSHDLLPVMDQCFACHDDDTATQECSACHTQPDQPTTYTWQTTPDLVFPHQIHLTEDILCERCHATTAGSEALVPRTPPEMESCMDCHAVPLTDAGCYTCHASLKEKLPTSHDPDWPEVHGLFTQRGSDSECSMCHQQADCESCHAQTQLEKKVHPANYEFLHAGEFIGFEKECSTCHAMPEDCRTCHQSLLIMPLNHNSPGWAITRDDGGYHHDEAEDLPDYCVVCHEPATDVTCTRAGCHVF